MAKLKLLYVEYTFAFLLLLGGFALTTVAASIYQQHYNTQVAAAFKKAAQERIQAISDFLDYSLFTIRSVDAFYEASTDVNESEFSTFIKPLVENSPYIRAVAWAPVISNTQRKNLERMLAVNHPGFTITTRNADGQFVAQSRQESYLPIAYSFPPRDAANGLGYDINSDNVRKTAIDAARAKHHPRASRLLTFLSKSDQTDLKGVAIYSPIYKNAQDSATPSGFIASTVSLHRIVEAGLKPLAQQGMHIILTDMSPDLAEPEILQIRSSRLKHVDDKAILASLHNDKLLRETTDLNYAGRKWNITIIQDKDFFKTTPSGTFYVILAAGMLFTLILTLYLTLISRAKDRIRMQVLDRTAALTRAKRNTELILESTHEGIIGINRHGNISFCNPYARILLGYSKNDNLVGRDYHSTIRPALNGEEIARSECHILKSIHNGNTVSSSIHDFTCSDGRELPVEFTSAPVVENDDISGAVIIFRDVTERRENDQRMIHAAGHDQMTGLFNRRSFDITLDSAVARAERGGRKCALMYMDLNGFKKINDELGHDAGDVMLRAFAQRLKSCMRETDSVARLGGDEFAVICEMIDDTANCEAAINRLLADIATTPVDINGKPYYLSSSIGMAVYPDHANSAPALIKAADQAMYAAKKDKSLPYAIANG